MIFSEMINCPFCCKVEYDAATNLACPGCGVSLYKNVDVALSYDGQNNVAEDYCPTCGRPDGAGHENKCLDTRAYDPDKASWEDPIVTCNGCGKKTGTPYHLTDGVICFDCWKAYVKSKNPLT